MTEPKTSQGELRLNLADEAEPEWEQFPVPAVDGKLPAGAKVPIRRGRKIIEIDFDGEILRATRSSRDRIFLRLPDGLTIQEVGSKKFMLQVALVREYWREIARSKRAEEHERELREAAEKARRAADEQRERERAIGEHLVASAEEKADRPINTRSRNKLAREVQPSGPPPAACQPEFVNPKTLYGPPGCWEYGPVFGWLNGVPGISQTEKSTYGWMAFRAHDDGVFRGSLRKLARRDVNISWQHMIQNLG